MQIHGATMFGTSATNQNLTDLINWAIDDIAVKMRLYGFTTLDATLDDGDGIFDLSDVTTTPVATKHFYDPKIVTVKKSSTQSYPLIDVDGHAGISSYQTFARQFPHWRDASAGTPKYAFMLQEDRLGVYPRPDATYEAYTWYIEGYCKPRPLVYANDSALDLGSFGLPQRSHFPIVLMAAIKGSLATATHEEAWARLERYYAEQAKTIEDIAFNNASLLMGDLHWQGQKSQVTF